MTFIWTGFRTLRTFKKMSDKICSSLVTSEKEVPKHVYSILRNQASAEVENKWIDYLDVVDEVEFFYQSNALHAHGHLAPPPPPPRRKNDGKNQSFSTFFLPPQKCPPPPNSDVATVPMNENTYYFHFFPFLKPWVSLFPMKPPLIKLNRDL